MPKSRHRKNQKKKSKVRSQNVKNQQQAFKKRMEKEFLEKMEELRNQQTEIEEVGDKPVTT